MAKWLWRWTTDQMVACSTGVRVRCFKDCLYNYGQSLNIWTFTSLKTQTFKVYMKRNRKSVF